MLDSGVLAAHLNSSIFLMDINGLIATLPDLSPHHISDRSGESTGPDSSAISIVIRINRYEAEIYQGFECFVKIAEHHFKETHSRKIHP